MNWSSNDVFIAGVSPRACELVHTPGGFGTSREPTRSTRRAPAVPERGTSSHLSACTPRARMRVLTEADFETNHFLWRRRAACGRSCPRSGAGRSEQGCARIPRSGRETPDRAAAPAGMRAEGGSREGAAQGSHCLPQSLPGDDGGQAIALTARGPARDVRARTSQLSSAAASSETGGRGYSARSASGGCRAACARRRGRSPSRRRSAACPWRPWR